jgi:hypothetical protein
MSVSACRATSAHCGIVDSTTAVKIPARAAALGPRSVVGVSSRSSRHTT